MLKLRSRIQNGKSKKSMPAFHKIDKERRLVMSSASGVFPLADGLSRMDMLSKDRLTIAE